MKKIAQYRQKIQSKRAQVSAIQFNKKSIVVYLAMMFASNGAEANPTGGEFAQGVGAISNTAGLTTIQQTTQQAIVNWQSFGSNEGEVIKFVQPNANAAILNRVVGNLPSNLNGMLEGNGRVYLINPNGIVLGANGVINVNGGFVGSTQGISDSAFMQGGALLFSGENTGSIQILGKIQSAQGDIVIIAPKTEIAASATLQAGQNIQLIAANEVQLSNGKFTVTPKLSDAGQLTVAGTLEAAKVQLEAHNNNLGALAINTTGTIRANATQTNPDGSVSIMAYGEGSNIKVSGNIVAQNNDPSKEGGRIIVGRNEATGELAEGTDVSGASFTTSKGFVETSGHQLTVDGTQVAAKDWLLDPDNLEITNGTATSGYSAISATALSDALTDGTSITITTTAGTGTYNSAFNNGGTGNIKVTNAIAKATDAGTASLSLIADDSITLNAGIGATNGNLNVTLKAGNTTSTGGITVNSAIDAKGGDVILQTQGGKISSNAAVTVGGNNITMDNTGGTIGTGGFINLGTRVGTSQGVYLSGGVTATGNLNIAGVTNGTGAAGVQIQGNSALVKGQSINIYGQSANERGLLALSSAQIEATNGDLSITANSTFTGSSAIDVQGNSLLTASGNIVIDGENVSTSQPTVTLTGNGVTSTGGNVRIAADSLNLGSALSATTGTVTIQNKNAGVKVNLGGADVLTAGSKTLGLMQTELNKIRAANTVIGSNTAGDLTVSSAITSADATGHLTLLSNANIAINATLQTGPTAHKNMTVTTQNGTLSVAGAVAATGNIILTGINNSASGHGVFIDQAINAPNGALTLIGKTSAATNNTSPYAGIRNSGTVTAKNIVLTAEATNSSSNAIGYYGGGHLGGSLIATDGTLNATASSVASGAGFYTYGGNLTATQGVNISGTSTNGPGVAFDYQTNIQNTPSGDITINGTASAGQPAIRLNGVSINNSHAGVSLISQAGNITSLKTTAPWLSWDNTITGSGPISLTAGQSAFSADAIDGTHLTITQNGNAATTIQTTGTGNLTSPKIVNNGTGDVVIAAGSYLLAGNGAGGQVRFATGNTITNNNGRTYIYTGNVADSANISDLNPAFGDIVLLGSAQNTKTNAAYNERIANTSAAMQVMYRENIKVEIPGAYGKNTLSNDLVLLTPVTFGFGVAGGATAAGSEVEGSCDAWSQRAGAGSISVVSLLKPTYMGLRTAKTDTMDAMAGSLVTGAVTDASENPCASAALPNKQASL